MKDLKEGRDRARRRSWGNKTADKVGKYAAGVIDTVRQPLVLLDSTLRVIAANKSFHNRFRTVADEALGENFYDIGDRQWDIPAMHELLETILPEETAVDDHEIEHTFPGIGHKILMVSGRRICRGASACETLLGFEDITESRLIEKNLVRLKERYERAFNYLKKIINSVADPIFVKDRQHRWVLLNDAFCKFTGYSRDELRGKTDHDIFPSAEADIFRAKDEIVFATGQENINEEQVTDANGVAHTIVTKKNVYTDESGRQFIVGIMRDISERKQMEETIRHQAFYDPLTDLANRRLFVEYLTLEMARAHRNNMKLAIFFLDIDNFKAINDTLGHATGDELLKDVARRLKFCVRSSDLVARFGGDEFNILMYDVTVPGEMAVSAQKLLSVFDEPFMIEGHELHVSTSIGISIYPDDGRDADNLLRHADMAMYHSKERGRNTFQFYEPHMNVRTLERASLEYHLRRAIEQGELLVYYQPQVDMATRRVTCVEALIRWRHPTLGLLNPMGFLPLAEESGLILPIDSWILRAACAQNKSWQQAGVAPIRVSVNLSAKQFKQPDFAEKVSDVLRETGLSPEYLDLEITENTVMRDIEMNIPNLTKLTDMGVSFAIDDFGTGYTSLGWLMKLPVEKLKIDKSLMKGIEGQPDNRAIINAIIAMAHNLKLKVVAEGVETEAEAQFLRYSGCDEMQGHVFSRALPAEEVIRYM
jgi:diguanylate cyclase (GGDEF)-like protein/PAS domain S-box-containing protein